MATGEGQPLRGGAISIVALFVGVITGIISLYIAYVVTYRGAGPDPDDTEAWILLTGLVLAGMIFALVMIYMGAVAFMSPGMSGEEATSYAPVRRKGS